MKDEIQKFNSSSDSVPKGYKKTEVGVIPEDWEVRPIGDLKPFVTSGSRGWAEFYADRGAPFIRITNLSRGSIYLELEDLRLVNLPKDSSEGVRTQLRDHDVLISITADIGIIGYISTNVPKPAYINQHIALVRFDLLNTTPKFVSYFLASEKPQKLFSALTDSGAKAGMSLTTVKKILLALPPTKAEQEAIAGALSDADALIESLEQLIAKKRHLKQGAMQELLTGKKRLPGFQIKLGYKQTEIGVIPEDWHVKKISELCEYQNGISLEYLFNHDDGLKVISIGNYTVTGSYLDNGVYINHKNRKIVEKFVLRKNDLTMSLNDKTSVGAIIGRVLLINQDDLFVFNQRTMRLRPKHNVSPAYLHHLINADRTHNILVGLAKPGTQIYINTDDVIELNLPTPSFNEQTAIATILSDMDAEITALESKLTKTRSLKQGMMHNLLTGKIRLVESGKTAVENAELRVES